MTQRSFDMHDSYHDDPIAPVDGAKKRSLSSIMTLVVLAISGAFFLQTTLASNITLTSGEPVEFGQGILQATSCSGSTQLSVTPNAVFVNESAGGSFKFKSITVSGIPANCQGADFTINAYGNSGDAQLALFNSTSTSVVVHNNGGTFEAGIGSAGFSLTSGSGTFTVSFDAPVTLASSIYKITIQSGAHTLFTCAMGGPCLVDGVGPGEGTIFYYNVSGFSCGTGHSVTGSPDGGLCHYLEVAPNTWSGGSTDTYKSWAVSAHAYTDIAGIANDGKVRPYPSLSTTSLGLGLKNSDLIVAQGNDATSAAGATRAYSGGGQSDWYLPTMTELNLLCQWSKGTTLSVTTPCVGGGIIKGGLEANAYWSSSEASADWAWYIYIGTNYLTPVGKSSQVYLRPIRAF